MRPVFFFLVLLVLPVLVACQGDAASRQVVDPHQLAKRGETASLLEALTSRDDIDRRDACYRTPLMFAAQFGHIDTVRKLLAAGARVDLHEKGYYTALMLAAGNGHAEVVQLLADAGARVNEVEITHGWTALIWAAKRGHRDTVVTLLALGANPAARDDRGWTARDWANAQGHATTAALL